jgi:hypothetical protein
MKIALLTVLAACWGAQPAAQPAAPTPATPEAPPEIKRRRDAACEKVGARLTACAVADAEAALAAGQLPRAEFDAVTDPDVLRRNTAEFVKQCKVPMSSRQVRVLEVCDREETECDPFADCLQHLNRQPR